MEWIVEAESLSDFVDHGRYAIASKPLVRCEDCKYYTLKPQVNSNNCYTRHCTRSALIFSKPDDYCSWAERRTDERQT